MEANDIERMMRGGNRGSTRADYRVRVRRCASFLSLKRIGDAFWLVVSVLFFGLTTRD